MSATGGDLSNPELDGPRPIRRPKTGVRSLLVLVACCAAILWAWRYSSENSDPVLAEARSIQKRAIRSLGSEKPAERLTAIVELERLGAGDSSVAIPPLIGTLEDPVGEVRVAAAGALASLGSRAVKSLWGGEAVRQTVRALGRSLDDPDMAVRLAAFQALGSLVSRLIESRSGGEAVRDAATALLRSLKDPEPRVRVAAVAALRRIAPPGLELMKTPPIDRKALLNALAELTGDGDAGVRRAVIDALALSPRDDGDPPGALADGLKDESAANRTAAISGLNFSSRGLDPWVPLLFGLLEHDPDRSVREQCMGTLGYAFKPPAITPAVIPVLIASLKSADAKVRGMAASLLGEFRVGARVAVPELLRMLKEPLAPAVLPLQSPSGTFDPGWAAARALGRIAPGSPAAKEAIAALMEVVRSGPTSRRSSAAYALGELGPAAEEAVPVLIQLLKDTAIDNSDEREGSAAWALGRIAPDTRSADRAVAALLPVLQSKDYFSRDTTIQALAKFGPRAAAAIPALRVLKNDLNAGIKEAAAKALLAIEDETAP